MSTSKATAKVSVGQLGGLSALIRDPGLFLLTLFRGGYAGRDSAGNQYFERPGSTRARRWVIYSGTPDASTVPPEWHAWLHHITDAPLELSGEKPWQRPHQPNATGTPASYRPAGHDYEGGQRASASADYESWAPDHT
jgi:NADH:ubiquinone oxidoreductase subunit